jgi:hypothetical protein
VEELDNYSYLSNKMNNELIKVHHYKLTIWKEYVVFHWHWWFGVALTIIPLVIWLIYRDKKSTNSLLLAGLTSGILSAYWDTTGHFFGWFDYQYDVSPMASNYLPWDFVLIPILTMFTIQLVGHINPYIKGFVLSALASFIGLPILKLMGIYKIMHWNYIYSFIVMYFIFVISFLMSKIKNT